MADPELYDRDFVAWTEEQARLLRGLPGTLNAIDISHLAAEIEDMGKREIREIESFLTLIYRHLILAAFGPDAPRAHWRGEASGFRTQLERVARMSPRVIPRIDAPWAWRRAAADAAVKLDDRPDIRALGERAPPFGLQEVIDFDIADAILIAEVEEMAGDGD